MPNRAATYPAELRVRLTCQTVSEFLDQHAADVSRGGIFVRHAQVLPVGRTVRLNLQLAGGTTLLAGEGTVFWTREADSSRAESDPGMGIRFTRLTTDSQQMLTHLLAEKVERERYEEASGFDDDERTVVASQEEMRAAAESGHDHSTSPSPLSVVTMEVDFESPAPISSRRMGMAALPPPFPHSPAVPARAPVWVPSGATAAAAPPGTSPSMAAPLASPMQRVAAAISHPILPVPPEAQAAAWEIEDAPLEHVAVAAAPLSPESDPELTDFVPRTRRNIGVGILVGALAALAVCFVLLRTPAAKPLPAPTPVAASVAAAPMPMPAVVTETAVVPAPSTPVNPPPAPSIPPAIPAAPTTPVP
ncbi:MAG TPA: TIGR02266 family protein [Polyangia bacterium]|nr:TIGR02266 family protein [Polyangia bacterium]